MIKANTEKMIKAIKDIGYDAKEKTGVGIDTEKEIKEKEINTLRKLVIYSAILTVPLVISMVFRFFKISGEILDNPWLQVFLSSPVQFIVGFRYYKGAWNNLKNMAA